MLMGAIYAISSTSVLAEVALNFYSHSSCYAAYHIHSYYMIFTQGLLVDINQTFWSQNIVGSEKKNYGLRPD